MSDKHALLTGPIRGSVTLSNGKEIDVRPEVIYLDSHDEAKEAAHLIGERYAAEGHPLHDPGDEFVHDTEGSRANFEQKD